MQELLAKEQQEEQVLRAITGVQRLEDVTFLDAVVDCSETSLSNLGEKMPLLRELKLNSSALSSVRDLGSKLRHLQVLWVSHCRLTGLDGLNALPSLKELYAAFNQIDNLEPIADMEKLEVLDLEGNKVDDLGGLMYLSWCPQLAVLTLADNPVALDPNYHSQVSTALPKLQVLDDTKLGRPLSPVFSPAHTHRQLHAATAEPNALACTPAAISGSSTTAGLAVSDGSSHAMAGTVPTPAPPQHARSDAAFSRVARGPTKQHRPASASRLQQRLPPVAAGHNQPGRFLLYSLNQMPTDALLKAQHGGQTALQCTASRTTAANNCTEHPSALGSSQACSQHTDEVSSNGGLYGAESKKPVRPASAGIRPAENRLHSPSPSETSRPGSANANDARGSAEQEGTGLFWRKHRLLIPQGYTMTEEQAQAASTLPAANAAESHAESALSSLADAVCMSLTVAAQQEPFQTDAIGDGDLAAQLQEQPDGSEQAAEAVDPAEGSAHGGVKDSALADAETLIIEDAAKLTCHRAAVILRQLSYECHAAVDGTYNSSCAPPESSAADDAQLPAYDMQHLESDFQAEACHIIGASADSPAAAVAVEVDQMQEADSICRDACMARSSMQTSTSGRAIPAAGWQADQHRAVPSRFAWSGGGEAVSLHNSTAGLDTDSLQAGPGRDAGQKAEQPGLAQEVAQSAIPASRSTSKQGSSFLQRLQMSKQASKSGRDAALDHHEDQRPGAAGPAHTASPSPRPPSPERPPTPSSKPARRRHLIPALVEAETSPPVSPSWAGSNRMFAPMPQRMPWDSAATVQARPASASAAESAHCNRCELSWTGSMQLPTGLLKLTSRPQQPVVGRRDKHNYDWGFGNARGLV